jgi:hypothetical protein
MTQKKISELIAASTLAGTEILPVVQSSATVKATVAQVLANLNASNLTSGTVPLARLSGITNTEIDASANIAWSKISKTGSSFDDLAGPSQSGNTDKALVTDGANASWGYPEGCFIVACSDETTALTTGVKVTMLAPFAMTLKDVRGVLTTASSSGDVVVDIHKGGTSVMTTDKITIEATETDSDDATTQPALTTTAVADGDKLEFEVDSAGTSAAGLKVYIYYVRG